MSIKSKPQSINFGGASLTKTGTSRFDLGDPYHLTVTATWPAFFAGFVGIWILINFVFAGLYTLDAHSIANARPRSLLDAFFFSMETLATVGYGTMSPGSTYGHILSATELICGLAFTALVTGIIFVRFSKVKPKMLFADSLVVSKHNGKPTLMLRLAYGRSGILVAANVRINVLKAITTTEGRVFRNAHELKLVRSHMPLLVLTWTLMHEIDEHSPLHGMTPEEVIAGDLRVIATIHARDHSLSSEIFDLRTYSAQQIKFGMVYQDLVTFDEHLGTHADVRKIDLIQPE